MLQLRADAPLQQYRQGQQQRLGDQPGQTPFDQQPALGLLVLLLHRGDVAPDQRRCQQRRRWLGPTVAVQGNLIEHIGAAVGTQQAQGQAALRLRQHARL